MRFRSSGLGEDKELIGYISELSPVGEDLLVLHIQTTEPVKWHLRAGIQFSDIPKVVKSLLKLSVILLMLRVIFYTNKKSKEPKDF